jgi:hypothetical protein
MVRDIEDRLVEFGVTRLTVTKLALWEQIQEFDPPPNPVKMSDSRQAPCPECGKLHVDEGEFVTKAYALTFAGFNVIRKFFV